MTERIIPCARCGTPTFIDLLDAKDDGTGDFNRLECRLCYGPGWVRGVMSVEPFNRSWLSTFWLSLMRPLLRRLVGAQ